MIRNYLKIAFRNLLRNKTFSVINIVGLSVGTVCCLYIILYVTGQYSYDQQHPNAADIYRVNSRITIEGVVHTNATSSPPIVPAMKNDFPEVGEYTRVVQTVNLGAAQHLLTYNGEGIYEKNAVYADSTFFNIFNFHFIYGRPRNALSDPYTVVLMKGTAEKLFGNSDPVGKTIEMSNAYGKNSFRVTGVLDESMGKSHIKANIFMSMNSGGMGGATRESNSWAAYNYVASYVRLRPGTDPATLERKLPAFLQKYGAQQLKDHGMQKELHLQQVGDIHTTKGYDNEFSPTNDRSFLNRLLLIAILIQVMACINFMNLSTARASKRAKEVGIRKVIGARMNDIISQFLGEALLLSVLAILVSIPLLGLLLPVLNRLTDADINIFSLANYRFALLLMGFVFVTGLLAGSYPAFYLSAFKPISVLKGNFSSRLSSVSIRRLLIVFQFSLSIVFVSGIIVIARQLNYLKNMDIGFERTQKLIFNFHTDEEKTNLHPFISDLRQLSGVKTVSQADNYPSQKISHDWPYYLEAAGAVIGKDVQFIFSDENYVKTLGIQLLSGRDFRAGDSGKVVINETFAKELGLTTMNATGRRLYPQHDADEPIRFVEIIGVMKDYNNNSLHDEVQPLMLRYDPAYATNNIIAAADTRDYQRLLKNISAIWQRNFPQTPFAYSFLDEDVQQQYEAEVTLSNIINSFTLIAIFICCLGLFGLSAFMAEQRKKEIGIRKVLGANLLILVSLLSRDFLKLAGIAFIVAIPFAWWALDKWLQTFAYRITLAWWEFALAGFVVMLIALSTVSIQAIRTAVANPVKSLKAE